MRHPQDQPLAPFFPRGIEEGFLLLWIFRDAPCTKADSVG